MKIILAMFEVRCEDDDERDMAADVLIQLLAPVGFEQPYDISVIPGADDPDKVVCISIEWQGRE